MQKSQRYSNNVYHLEAKSCNSTPCDGANARDEVAKARAATAAAKKVVERSMVEIKRKEEEWSVCIVGGM